jgi:hypothetical protein
VGKDDIALIASDVFPRDLSARTSETLARLSEAISVLADAGLIARYVANGEELVYVDKWSDIQRIDKPGKGRFPRPDGTMEYSEPVNRDSYRNPRETVASPPETLAPGTGEQGNRGTGEQTTTGALDEPPPDDEPPAEVAIDDAPEFIDNGAKPSRPHPSSATQTVVRQVLGSAGYPKTTVDRLATQVGKLAREGHPDALIRASLTEWDRRPDCAKPEFLPTVLADLVKASRSGPAVNKQDVKVNGFLAYANPSTPALEIER